MSSERIDIITGSIEEAWKMISVYLYLFSPFAIVLERHIWISGPERIPLVAH